MANTYNFGSGASGAFPSTGNQSYNTSPKQEWLSRTLIKNLEPELYFYTYGKKPDIMSGYYGHSFARAEKQASSIFTNTSAGDPTSNSNTLGVTPAAVDVRIGTIDVAPEEYVVVTRISTMLQRFNVVSYVEAAMREFSRAAGRKIDDLTQSVVTTYAGRSGNDATVYYSSTGTPVTSINGFISSGSSNNKSTTLFTLNDIAKAVGALRSKDAPTYPSMGGVYACILHPAVEYDLRRDTGANQWIDIEKHTMNNVGKVLRGSIGTIQGANVVVTSNVQTFSSTGAGTPTVYPTFFFGMGAYGCLRYQYSSYVTGMGGASDSDPANQRVNVGLRFTYNALVLEGKSIVINYSQASVDFPN